MKAVTLRLLTLAFLLCCSCSLGMAQKTARNGASSPSTHSGNAPSAESKIQWIKDHPEEYRSQGGDPESVLNATATTTAAKVEFKEGATFLSDRNYRLAKVEAVAIKGSNVGPGELEAETAGLQKEWPIGETQFQATNDGRIRILIPNRADLRATELRTGKQATWTFKDANCVDCSKVLNLSVEAESPDGIIYVMDSEDGDASMAYRFVFQRIATK